MSFVIGRVGCTLNRLGDYDREAVLDKGLARHYIIIISYVYGFLHQFSTYTPLTHVFQYINNVHIDITPLDGYFLLLSLHLFYTIDKGDTIPACSSVC